MNTPAFITTGATASVSHASEVATSESYNNAAYGDCATPGPAASAATQTTVLVYLASGYASSGSATTGTISVAVSGATTLAAADANGTGYVGTNVGFGVGYGRTAKLTSLTAGTNTFTEKYKGGLGSFFNRGLVALVLPT